MNNWRNYMNYRKRVSADGSVAYFIIVDGAEVEVSEKVYREYAAYARKMKYMELDLKRDRVLQDGIGKSVTDGNGLPVILPEREISLDKLISEDWDYPTDEPQPEDAVLRQTEFDELHRCLGLLNDDERALIGALFFDGLTESEYAKVTGVKQQSVNERKRRILEKIKSLFGQPC